MSSTFYTYSILQYRHSQVTGEVLNIGVLSYIPSLKRISFVHPTRLARLLSAFPNVNEKALKAYIKGFSLRVKILNDQPNIFADYDLENSLNKFAEKELIPPDSSALQFTEIRKGVSYASEPSLLDRDLFDTYLKAFNAEDENSQRVTDDFLIYSYKNRLSELINQYRASSFKDIHGLQYNYDLKIKEDKHFVFDIAWQNGSLNLVQAVSFDLKSADKILSKGYRNFGKFTDLNDFAQEKNYRFDLIVAPPKNKNFIGVYEDAIGLLHKPSTVNIILPKDLDTYSAKTIKALSSSEE